MPPTDDPPQIPDVGAVLGPGVAALIAARPTAANHLAVGRYGNIVRGWRGQFEIERKRLVEEANAARLPFAAGPALTELAASEYDTPRSSSGAVAAIGEVVLERSVVHYFRDLSILAPTAIDEATVIAALAALRAALPAHGASVFDPATGLGSHVVADATSFVGLPPVPTPGAFMIYFTEAANAYKAAFNAHLAGGSWHPEADAADIVSAPDATGAPIFIWSNAPTADRQGVLAAVNQTITAANKHLTLESRPGTIRAGTVFVLGAAAAAVPPIKGGQYAVIADTPVGTGVGEVVCRVRATRAGAFANIPKWFVQVRIGVPFVPTGPTLLISTPALFDQTAVSPFVATDIRAGGGSDGQSDEELRRAAAAGYQGSVAPTDTALAAGALRTVGASQTVVLPNRKRASACVYPVDASWAQSDAWLAQVDQEIRDNWAGFGARYEIGLVWNLVVRLEATVVLRDARDLADTSDIAAAIQETTRSYFDDRPDWYIFRLQSLRGAISHASAKILSCPIVIVRDATGVPLAEPAQPAAGSELIHYFFADGAIDVTFTAPS